MSDMISSLRDYLRTCTDAVQFFVNLVCVVILTLIGFRLIGYGMEAWRTAMAPPRTIEGATALATAAVVNPHATGVTILAWIIAGITVPVGLIVLYTALEGAWWLVRRLAGRA